jgi:ethanolamine transporter
MAILGDHLGFTAGVAPDMITPMILGKLAAAVAAIALAWAISTRRYPRYDRQTATATATTEPADAGGTDS